MEKDRNKYHWSSWHKLSFPVIEGGNGFRTMKDVCQSMRFKHWWIFRSKISLWSNFLRVKYYQRSQPISNGGFSINFDILLLLHATYPAANWPHRWVDLYSIIEDIKHCTTTRQVVWTKPNVNFVKINTNGSAMTNPMKIGGGGIIRNHLGEFLQAIACPLGEDTNNLAKT